MLTGTACCPVCHANAVRPLYSHRSGEMLFVCARCRAAFFPGRPTEDPSRSEYWTDRGGNAPNIDIYEEPATVAQLEKRHARYLEWLEDETGAGTIVDYGCGLGGFVDLAARRGWRAVGIDTSEWAVQYARSRGRSAWTLEEWIREPPADVREADAAVMLDVLEHVDDPHLVLRFVASLLAPGGVLLVETPSWRYLPRRVGLWIARASRGRIDWVRYLVYPDHRVYFTPQALADILTEHGFRILWQKHGTSPEQKILQKLKQVHGLGVLDLLLARSILLFTRALGGNKILLCARKTVTGQGHD